jgi:F-type H+-transporting ATPase subunit b
VEGIGNLGIEWRVLIIQGISFLVLFGTLIFVAYKPLLKILDERSKKIQDSLDQAESVKDQSLHAEEELRKQLQAASSQSQEIVGRANKASDEIRAQARDLAKKDADILIEQARQAIKSERDEALREMRQEFAELTILAAGKVIGETLDKESHKKLIDKVLEESKTLNQG